MVLQQDREEKIKHFYQLVNFFFSLPDCKSLWICKHSSFLKFTETVWSQKFLSKSYF